MYQLHSMEVGFWLISRWLKGGLNKEMMNLSVVQLTFYTFFTLIFDLAFFFRKCPYYFRFECWLSLGEISGVNILFVFAFAYSFVLYCIYIFH